MALLSRKLLASYSRLLTTHPIVTKTVTASAIAAAGDVACQVLTAEKPREFSASALDKHRTFRMVVFTCGMTPLVHHWYLRLSGWFPNAFHRMLCDQVFWAPLGLAAFLGSNSLLEEQSLPLAKQQITESFLPVLKANYMVWPAIQLINFKFVPGPYQVLVVNVARWVNYSYLKSPTISIDIDISICTCIICMRMHDRS